MRAASEERGKLFQLDGPPLWRLADSERIALQQQAVREEALEAQPALEVFQFSVRSVERMLIRQAVAFVIICAILLLARRHSAAWIQDEDAAVRKLGIAVGRPISLAILLSLLGGLIWTANVPDFIANPGGVIAAFVELTSQSADKAEEAKSLTREKIAANVRELFAIAERHRAEPQHAGLYMALAKISQTS